MTEVKIAEGANNGMNMNKETAWGTGQELLFLAALGSHSGTGKLTRLELLHLYRMASRLRKNWGDIDRARVMDRLRKYIDHERQLAAA